MRYIYQSELDKTCFQHEIAHENFKDLNRRMAADNVLPGKAFNIAKNSKYDGHMAYKYFDKKPFGSGFKNENIPNKELAEELHKQLLENLIKEKYTYLLQTIFAAGI